ncbi:Arginine transport ATP-binding protein ArtP [Mannheimia haemolytica]|uniref:Arginine transport ATP-binding protein ArtP n=1 Tax=Mannheimia haemolytica TaxID=75985 RepID=A0A378N885_MANHA|nr:Arginine transport ATP-binding protein ArtP [Mannheimia haemolytica]
MEVPQSGTLAIANHQFDLTAKTDSKAVSLLRREVGMVFQQYHLWPHLTVMQNLIEAPMKVLGLSKEEAVARAKGHLHVCV